MTATEPIGTVDRLTSLTGIRTVAAGLVLLTHAFVVPLLYTDTSVQDATNAMVPLATSSVTLFFILSGIVLSWSARADDTALRFWRRRFVRIFANHVMAWLLAAGLVVACGLRATRVVDDDSFSIAGLAGSFFLVHTWVPSTEMVIAPNPPEWSLVCELFFYLLFPFLLPAVRRIPVRWLWPAAGLTVLASLSVPLVALSFPGPSFLPSAPVSIEQLWFAYFLPCTRLPEFVLGMLIARILSAGLWRPLRFTRITPLLVLALASLAFLPPVFAFGPYLALPIGLLLAEVASRDIRGVPSFLRHPVMVYWGYRSFAVYVIHYVVIMYLRQFVFGPTEAFGTLPATALIVFIEVPVALAAAWVLYRWVERPAVTHLSASSPQPRHVR